LLAWSLNFSTRITATPTAYGLVAADATAYATLHTSFATALASCDPDERNKIATAAKNTARLALKTSARLLAKRVEGTASVTDAQKLELGLNVRAMPSPIPPPATAPIISITSVMGRTVKIKLKSADSADRGKPEGVHGAAVFTHVGPTAPATADDWEFQANTGRTSFTIVFPDTVANGATVWFNAFWFNPRSESGPSAVPISVNLPGGSASLAA
jgi:hypothetical protein